MSLEIEIMVSIPQRRKHKKYIGTYETKIEADIVNDFYSIEINFFEGKDKSLRFKKPHCVNH